MAASAPFGRPMTGRRSTRRRYMLRGAAGMLVLAMVAGSVFALSGAYNVAASVKHFYITDRLIKLVLWRSIDLHSHELAKAPATDASAIRLGARHYLTGCMPCHGAPGRPQSPVITGMYPAPPNFGEVALDWQDEELAWIVFNGLKFTGMPHWPGADRIDEVWPVVSFLQQLPSMSPARFDTYARTGSEGEASKNPTLGLCAGCHGAGGSPPVSAAVPPLHGQSEAYLLRALEEYAGNRRQSGMMEPVAAALSASERQELASAFAAMPAPAIPMRAAPPETPTGLGETIAKSGLRERNVAACLSCHEGDRSPHFPKLRGLSKAYIATQLRLFGSGVRGDTPYGRIMQKVAQRLDAEEIETVAAYLERTLTATTRRAPP